MKIRKFIHAAMVAAVMLGVASCTNEDLLADNSSNNSSLTGEEVAVNFTYGVQALLAGDAETSDARTRVVLDEDGTLLPIKNMFVIQFNGNSPSSTMVGAPRFLDADDLATLPLSVPLIQNANSCFTLFVANIPEGRNYNWNMSTQSMFADVVKRVRTITGEAGAHVTVGSTPTLLVSAIVDSPVQPGAGNELTPEFTRNVAKLTLNLKLDNSAITIKSVRLRNVATSIVYADAALEEAANVTASTVYPNDFTTIDYMAITTTTDLPTDGVTKTYSWYVPRNQRGVNNASTGAADKTFYAPDDATYFEIIAVKGTGTTAETSVFRVYPGADETKDFNITANHHYTINLTVKGMGDAVDSRVEKFRNTVSYVDDGGVGSSSNSFILNPAPAGGNTRYYDIPVTQVNRYWGGTTAGYGNTPTNMIGDNDTWTVSLIWSDLDGLYSANYSDAASKICLDNNGMTNLGNGKGKGPADFFRLSVPAGMPDGNFTIGIKKDGGTGEYLWSWHFWVTSYNPNAFNKSIIVDGVYTYPVPGGKVERYVDGTTNQRWGVGRNYENSVMMDRALGMVSDNSKKQPANALRGILHYQYGRKDPFASIANTANAIIGVQIEQVSGGGTVPIKTTMSNPHTFYYIAGGGNWTNEVNATTYMWNDPNALTTGTNKSIYDPCPPGWRVPANGTWNDFSYQVGGVYSNTQNLLRDLAYGYGRGIGSATSAVNGLRYWPGTAMDAPVGGTIWYPAAGYRASTSGSLGSVGSNGYYWSASPYSTAYGYYLYFYSGSVSPSNTSNRANGFSVRCVAE